MRRYRERLVAEAVTEQRARRPVLSYLGLGSNLGDRGGNIKRAVELLAQSTALVSVSSLYETEPWGYEAQPRFLNAACAVETTMPPLDLLRLLRRIERDVGRRTTFPLGPRIIDLDMLLYGQEVIRMEGLTVPHQAMAERAFVLVPLAEIGADVRHPVLGVTVGTLLASLKGKTGVHLWAPPG